MSVTRSTITSLGTFDSPQSPLPEVKIGIDSHLSPPSPGVFSTLLSQEPNEAYNGVVLDEYKNFKNRRAQSPILREVFPSGFGGTGSGTGGSPRQFQVEIMSPAKTFAPHLAETLHSQKVTFLNEHSASLENFELSLMEVSNSLPSNVNIKKKQLTLKAPVRPPYLPALPGNVRRPVSPINLHLQSKKDASLWKTAFGEAVVSNVSNANFSTVNTNSNTNQVKRQLITPALRKQVAQAQPVRNMSGADNNPSFKPVVAPKPYAHRINVDISLYRDLILVSGDSSQLVLAPHKTNATSSTRQSSSAKDLGSNQLSPKPTPKPTKMSLLFKTSWDEIVSILTAHYGTRFSEADTAKMRIRSKPREVVYAKNNECKKALNVQIIVPKRVDIGVPILDNSFTPAPVVEPIFIRYFHPTSLCWCPLDKELDWEHCKLISMDCRVAMKLMIGLKKEIHRCNLDMHNEYQKNTLFNSEMAPMSQSSMHLY